MAGFGAIDQMLEGLRAGAPKSSAVPAEAESESAFVQPELGSIKMRPLVPGRWKLALENNE